jgi:transposase
MFYIGLDVHLKQSSLCILGGDGRRVVQTTIRGGWTKVLDHLKSITEPFAICYEASCGYGFLFDRLSQIAQRVVVAHHGQLRLIFRSKRKNDRVDAENLPKLLWLDEVPTVHVPSSDVRSWRSLIEQRQQLIRKRTRVKNSLRALLRGHGVAMSKGLWSGKSLAWLENVTFDAESRTVQTKPSRRQLFRNRTLPGYQCRQ